jgi:hypothetical protein
MKRIALATRLALRDQLRRPLLLVLLVGLPFFFITRAIAQTEPTPRVIGLPGGTAVLTTMKALHGANMAAITVAFLAGLCGVFLMQAAQSADRRLVVAGFRPLEAVTPRVIVLFLPTVAIVVVSLAVTALSFTPNSWLWFGVGVLSVGLTYGAIGGLAGAVLGRLGATYLILFAAFLDIGIAQNPMFGSGVPPDWARFLPGYGAGRVIIDGAFSPELHAGAELALAGVWILVAVGALLAALRYVVTGATRTIPPRGT